MDKAALLLGDLSGKLQELILDNKTVFPEIVAASVPKISKGENYKGLPYLVLDYPRHFVKDDILAIRTLFWWGNFFSVTLHIGGMYKKHYESALLEHLLQRNDYQVYLFTGVDQWQHHFEEDNYVPVSGMDTSGIREAIRSMNFIKLAYRYPLEQWEQIPALALAQSAKWLRLLVD